MTIYFAHRGSVTEAPENTMPSFERALRHGVKGLELDVQLTKDGHLVINHDQRINRVASNGTGFIRDFTLEEIRQFDVGGKFSAEFEGVTFATLEEVVAFCPSDVLLNIEIKNIPYFYEGIEKKVVDCLKAHDRVENTLISSFDHKALKRMEELAPEIPLGLLFMDNILDPWSYAKHCGIQVYSLHPRYQFVDKTYMEKCHEEGFKVFPWTVDDEDVHQYLLSIGVDGIISNNPKIFGV